VSAFLIADNSANDAPDQSLEASSRPSSNMNQTAQRGEAADRRRMASSPSGGDVSVLVAESGGAIQIVSAATDMDGPALARWRRIAETTASEYGLRLESLAWNGAPITSSVGSSGDAQS
jgi:hypothetical protein